MSVMDDMLAWLTTTLDLVEQRARDALNAPASADGPWARAGRRRHSFNNGCHENYEAVFVDATGPERWDRILVARDSGAVADHIALHDPRAVLARVAAERAILAEIASSTAQYPDFDGGHVSGLENAAMLIAWGHRFDAPGFLAEWAPSDVEVTT